MARRDTLDNWLTVSVIALPPPLPHSGRTFNVSDPRVTINSFVSSLGLLEIGGGRPN